MTDSYDEARVALYSFCAAIAVFALSLILYGWQLQRGRGYIVLFLCRDRNSRLFSHQFLEQD
ncbi:MAG: hypothetical protein AB4290_01475 [Spirulina sp.]